MTAFRIGQESLTNIVRHAEAGTAQVELTYGNGDLTLQIDDDGRGPAAQSGGGSGISGMRDRATALGGELEAGPQPTGGFRVRARGCHSGVKRTDSAGERPIIRVLLADDQALDIRMPVLDGLAATREIALDRQLDWTPSGS